MFEPIPELSSDLEWMLQSGQASPEMLAEALVQEYGETVYRLALAYMDDRKEARQVLQDTIGAGLLNVYRYKSGRPVDPWWWSTVREALKAQRARLQMRRAVKTGLPSARKQEDPEPHDEAESSLWLAVDRLKESERFPLLMSAVLGWQPEKISATLGIAEREVEDQLATACRKVWAELPSGLVDGDIDLDSWIARSLQARWPALRLAERDREVIAAQAVRQAEQQGARRRGVSYVKELALVGAAIVFVVGLIYGINRLYPEQESDDRSQRGTPRATFIARSNAAQSTRLPSATPVPEGVYYRIQRGDTLESIAARLSVAVDDLVQLNRLPPDVELMAGQRLLIPGALPRKNYATPTPIQPMDSLPPLGIRTSPQELAERVRASRPVTFWLDARRLDYGPPGYIGPAKIYHIQVWYGQDQLLVLGASQDESPDEVLLSNESQFYRARPSAYLPWFFSENPESFFGAFNRGGVESDSPLSRNLTLLFESLGDPRGGFGQNNLRIVGTDDVAGRETLLAEQTDDRGVRLAFLWLDTELGWVLRRQVFAPSGETVVKEDVLSGLAVNVDFPPELFDSQLPWRGGFAQDYTGRPVSDHAAFSPESPAGRERLPYREPPSKFDPAMSRLTFQLPLDFNPQEALGQADLFADGYFLGQVEFGNPLTTLCARSPDGMRVAYVSVPPRLGWPRPNLAWFSLSNPPRVQGLLPGIFVSRFAFSPDSRFLAAVGGGGLYVVEVESGQSRKLISLMDANSLVWSPDGEELAFIARWTSPEEDVVVVRVETGAITFRDPIDVGSGPEVEWPMSDWGVDFPVGMGGLEACISPPSQ